MKRILTLTVVSVFWIAMGLGTSAWAEIVGLDHFQCYEIKDATKLDPAPVVSLNDQFGFRDGVKVNKKPETYCTPVDKNSEGIINGEYTLTCYRIDSHKVDSEIAIENQFGPQEFQLKKSRSLCVPSHQLEILD